MAEDTTPRKAFDPARLVDIFGGDVTAIREVIDETRALMRDIFAKLAVGTAAARPQCTALVHELKGLSGNVGADELHALSQDIEGRLRDSSRDFNCWVLADLEEPYSRFLAGVERYLASAV
jgi:HPt (histidine-containing phosphotransfer) domain-containing protein